ncbi:MAG: bis-aminopropyl spermidine synthase family protein [Candidatus Kariarchaeaceae archaeon]|jgi:hypothetical protein
MEEETPNEQKTILEELIKLRKPENEKFDQKHISMQSLLSKIEVLRAAGVLNHKRVLAIGDSDLSGLAIAIFGKPDEVVVADIDKRLTDLLFHANLEYDLPVRFVFHDMRLRMIEILQQQFSLIIMEPPPSKKGLKVFISRSMACIEKGSESEIFITIPETGQIQDFFYDFVKSHNIEILESYIGLVEYLGRSYRGSFHRINIADFDGEIIRDHWIKPFYEREENQVIHTYRCKCGELIDVGKNQVFLSLKDLQIHGCKCGHKGVFVFNSDVRIV